MLVANSADMTDVPINRIAGTSKVMQTVQSTVGRERALKDRSIVNNLLLLRYL